VNLQRIFSHNKAEDTGNPLWIGKDDNEVVRKIDAKRRMTGSCKYALRKMAVQTGFIAKFALHI
jgi:hypothetical protein